MKFSNPRLKAVIEDYPSGGKRVTCVFEVEHNVKKGYRVLRTTTGKPKVSTYAGKTVIVDGKDGKTYMLRDIEQYGFVDIMRWDFKTGFPSVFKKDDRYEELMAIINSVYEEDNA